MAVDDHGLEAIRKAAEEQTPGDKSNYVIKTKISNTVDTPGIVQLADQQTGSLNAVSPSGTIETGELIRLVGGNFESGSLLPNLWQTEVVGSGTASVDTGELILDTGATANSIARVQSQNRARFITATFNKAHHAFQTPGFDNADVIRRWGMYDPITPVAPGGAGDGVFWENNSGVYTLNRRIAGVIDDQVTESEFNGSNPLIKDNNVHVYELVYNAGVIQWFQDRNLIHTMRSLDSVAYETVHLTLGAEIENINGNTTVNQLKSRGFSCSRIGSPSSQPDHVLVQVADSVTIKNSPGTLRAVIILNTGTGGSTIELYDDPGPAPFPAASLLSDIDLTDTLIGLEPNLDFNFGLSYVSSGAGFQVLLVFD